MMLLSKERYHKNKQFSEYAREKQEKLQHI